MGEMTEKCAWEVLDGSTLCLVSLTLHFLRATLSKRVNVNRLPHAQAGQFQKMLIKSTQLMNMYMLTVLGHKRECILSSRFPT